MHIRAGTVPPSTGPRGPPMRVSTHGNRGDMTSSISGRRVLGVAGGSGGLGTSVLAAAMAVRARAAGVAVVCVDGDPLGGGLDVTFGLEQEPGVRWHDLARIRGPIDGEALLQRLPAADGVPVLAFERQHPDLAAADVVLEVLAALCAAAELVVVDLPSPHSTMFEPFVAHLDAVVVLVGRQVRGLAAASVVVSTLAPRLDDVWVVLRSDHRLTRDFVAGISHGLDLPVLATLEQDDGIDADLLHGVPPGSRSRGPVRSTADQILARLLHDDGLQSAS